MAGNPFASVMNANATSPSNVGFGGTNGVQNRNVFGAPDYGGASGFVSDSSFSNAFGNDNSAAGKIYFLKSWSVCLSLFVVIIDPPESLIVG